MSWERFKCYFGHRKYWFTIRYNMYTRLFVVKCSKCGNVFHNIVRNYVDRSF